MSSSPEELGFVKPAAWPGDLFVEVEGVWRCSDCRRTVPEVDESGHAPECELLANLERNTPKTELRRRAVGEWPGLRAAILRDHDLRANLVSEIVAAYRVEYRRASKRALSLGVRGETGKAAKALVSQLKKAAKVFDDLERRELSFSLWWSTCDRLDGRGGPPKVRKKGSLLP